MVSEMAKKQQVESKLPTREIQSIVACAGAFEAVFNEGGNASFVRVACWAQVTEVTGREAHEIVVAMIPADVTTDADANAATLVFVDDEPNFMGIKSPETPPEVWDAACLKAEKAAQANGQRGRVEKDNEDADREEVDA